MDHCLKILSQTWLLIANENINYGKLNMYGNKLWRILLKSNLIEILSIQMWVTQTQFLVRILLIFNSWWRYNFWYVISWMVKSICFQDMIFKNEFSISFLQFHELVILFVTLYLKMKLSKTLAGKFFELFSDWVFPAFEDHFSSF